MQKHKHFLYYSLSLREEKFIHQIEENKEISNIKQQNEENV